MIHRRVKNDWYYTSEENPTLPSQVAEHNWLYFSIERYISPVDPAKSGKWMMFDKLPGLDYLWPLVKAGTSEGKLGYATKSSTPLTAGMRSGIICVYTRNFEDAEDIQRVLSELRNLGVTNPLSYKSDSMTQLNIRGSLFYSRSDESMKRTGQVGG